MTDPRLHPHDPTTPAWLKTGIKAALAIAVLTAFADLAMKGRERAALAQLVSRSMDPPAIATRPRREPRPAANQSPRSLDQRGLMLLLAGAGTD